ncbi:hypothetical protein Lal_00036255 [Lupinus albus]|nr:hypothetical protein Lal_00036255 [Lupinus albus]
MKNFQRYNLGPYTHSREESMVHRHSASGLVEAGVRFKGGGWHITIDSQSCCFGAMSLSIITLFPYIRIGRITYAFENWTYDICICFRKINSNHSDNKRKQNHFSRIGRMTYAFGVEKLLLSIVTTRESRITFRAINWTYDICICFRKINSNHSDNKRKQNHFSRIGRMIYAFGVEKLLLSIVTTRESRITFRAINWTYDICICFRKINSNHSDNKRKQNHFSRIGRMIYAFGVEKLLLSIVTTRESRITFRAIVCEMQLGGDKIERMTYAFGVEKLVLSIVTTRESRITFRDIVCEMPLGGDKIGRMTYAFVVEK